MIWARPTPKFLPWVPENIFFLSILMVVQSAEEKKITSGHRSTQPHFHVISGSNISPNRFWALWEGLHVCLHEIWHLIARGAVMRKNIIAWKPHFPEPRLKFCGHLWMILCRVCNANIAISGWGRFHLFEGKTSLQNNVAGRLSQVLGF